MEFLKNSRSCWPEGGVNKSVRSSTEFVEPEPFAASQIADRSSRHKARHRSCAHPFAS